MYLADSNHPPTTLHVNAGLEVINEAIHDYDGLQYAFTALGRGIDAHDETADHAFLSGSALVAPDAAANFVAFGPNMDSVDLEEITAESYALVDCIRDEEIDLSVAKIAAVTRRAGYRCITGVFNLIDSKSLKVRPFLVTPLIFRFGVLDMIKAHSAEDLDIAHLTREEAGVAISAELFAQTVETYFG